MKINNVLILSAGLGTRMGKIGKVLPKPLWPLFDKTLLDLQIDYVKRLGIENIYINTHYQSQKIHEYIQKKGDNDIVLLHEPDLLRIGGTIHNLVFEYGISSEYLLVINADQFYFPSMKVWNMAKEKIANYPAVLFPLKCRADSGYNKLLIDQNLLKGISSSDQYEYITFSGMSIINTNMLSHCSGKSDYFKTVANYQEQDIYILPTNDYSYYDFGTIDRYFNSCFRISKEVDKKNNFYSRLGLDRPLFNGDNILNYSKQKVVSNKKVRAIVLDLDRKIKITESGIYYKNIFDIC